MRILAGTCRNINEYSAMRFTDVRDVAPHVLLDECTISITTGEHLKA